MENDKQPRHSHGASGAKNGKDTNFPFSWQPSCWAITPHLPPHTRSTWTADSYYNVQLKREPSVGASCEAAAACVMAGR
jgi:hypothetical protein